MHLSATLLVVCFSVTLGCYPSVRHDQEKFCDSNYVFVGVPRRTIDQGADRAFLVTVQSNLRGFIRYPGSSLYIYGFGRWNSCGATVLQHGRQYIFYVNRDGLNPRKLSFSTNEVSIRQALSKMQNYDCSCDVIVGNGRMNDFSPINIEAPSTGSSPRDQ
uniref:Uncharacterized protein LOC111106204 n=1 Tax=Crassostrea virginica TaxID=6565 RepID=A0A8B8AZE1_CRAVI|nr:uncharacterized protein LOC111106204 [Crassostrea virginica]